MMLMTTMTTTTMMMMTMMMMRSLFDAATAAVADDDDHHHHSFYSSIGNILAVSGRWNSDNGRLSMSWIPPSDEFKPETSRSATGNTKH